MESIRKKTKVLLQMRITEIHALSASQVNDVLCLMSELNPGLAVTSEMIIRAAKSVNFHHFPLMDGERFMCTAPKSAVSSFYQKMGAEK